ncbi:MAG: HEPN domain-containing protein [Bacteroidetes bacterium]|nr:HEPN domain-containing protein [Bacteroidota bacterium]MCL6100963.1 HEPN domain-containing protein [Bacteroidota bacterium]
MTGDSENLIRYRINRSSETFMEADTLMQNGFWNATVNRIYYSCYYAVSALLLLKNIETNSHKGIRQMFGLHFVQSGLVSKEDGRFFSDLYDRRQTGDYDDFVSYDEETVLNLYNQAKGFTERMIELLNHNNL